MAGRQSAALIVIFKLAAFFQINQIAGVFARQSNSQAVLHESGSGTCFFGNGPITRQDAREALAPTRARPGSIGCQVYACKTAGGGANVESHSSGGPARKAKR